MGRHALTALSVLLATSVAGAQEVPEGRTLINAPSTLSWDEDGITVAFLTGGILVRNKEFTLQAARAMTWSKAGTGSAFQEIYAEGNVIFTRGAGKLRCDRFFYDLKDPSAPKGIVIDLRMQGANRRFGTNFYAHATEARLSADELVADNLKVTSCPYGDPHYHLEIGKATMRLQKTGEPGDWKRPPKVQDVHVGDPAVHGASNAFFLLPSFVVGPWARDFPLRSLRYGHTSRFGHFVYSDWGTKLRIDDAEGKPQDWGDVILEADWRQERGGAGGLDLKYGWGGYEGYVDTYYLHDLGRDPDLSFNDKFPPLVHDERGKVHLFHRHDVDEARHWRYEFEAYYLSDRDLLEEFFEKEFKEAPPPESAAYVRWLDGPLGAYFYERHRLNDFQTQDEFLPRVHFEAAAVPLLKGVLDNVYVTERFDVVNIRRRFDEDLHVETAQTWRIDSLTELFVPWDLGFVQISPYGQYRATGYSDDLEGDQAVRSLWTAGGRVVTQVHGTHAGVVWGEVGLRGLRHVAELEARYANALESTVDPSELFAFETVDALQEFEEVAFEFRQRFLTKDDAGKPFEFLSLTVGVEYYPDSERDTRSIAASNTDFPFNWIPLVPESPGVPMERRHWSNLHYDLAFRPRNLLSVTLSGEYNPDSLNEEARELGVAMTPFPGLSASISQTFVRGVTDAWTGGVAWTLTEKWSVSAAGQYDFRTREFLRQDVVLSRDFHDFLIQGVYERDFGRDESRFLVTFVPKFLGGAGFGGNRLYRAGDVAPP